MSSRLMLCTTVFLALSAFQPLHAGGADKPHVVGKDGLTLQGKVGAADPRVQLIPVAGQKLELPAQLFQVQLTGGKKYRVSLDSNDIDSVLVVQDKTGRQLAWDDDSGGGLNSLLTLNVDNNGSYKIYAASLKGSGNFTLKVQEDGAIKVHEVDTGLKIKGELGKISALTYFIKLAVGKTYVFDMISPNPNLLDPFLRLLDADGKQLAKDDDGGEGLNARIIFRTESAGTYGIVATSLGVGRGPFTLTVREVPKEEESRLSRIARASQLSSKVIALIRAGKDRQAVGLAQEALTIRKEVLGEKHPDYATSLNNLAGLYESQGDYAKAEPLYRQALEIRKQVLGEKHPDYADSLNNLAFLYKGQWDYAKAEPLYRQALEIRKQVLGEKHPKYADSLNNLAFLYDAQGNYAKAEPLYRQALDASQITKTLVPLERLQCDDLRIHPTTVTFLRNHAWLMQEAAAKDETLKTLRSSDHFLFVALAVLDRARQENLDHQQSKIQLTAQEFGLFPLRIKVLQKLFILEQKPQDLEAAFATAEQGTARAFLESLGKNRANLLAGVRPGLQSEESQLLQDIRLLDLRLDKESGRTLDKRNPDLIGDLYIQRRAAEVKLNQLVARMEKEHPQYAGLKYPRPCKLEEARACLAPEEVALLFVPGTKVSFVILVESRPNPGDKTNGLAIYTLPGSKAIAEKVATLSDSDTLERALSARALGKEAFDMLLGPLQDRIMGKGLVIVPGGALCFLPFELLVEEDGKYLVEKHRIRYAPSLTALHLIRLWNQKRAEPTVPLLAVGDPLYEAGDKRVTEPGKNKVEIASASKDGLLDLDSRQGKRDDLKRLVYSGMEVAEIAKLLGAKPEYLLTGKDASEAKVKAASAADQMARARYVHFATHGILGLDHGKQPALVLNLVGNTTEDGFLHLDEITGLKLNADLVVLSACRTGQGRMHQGEGVTGLARAFLYAGSKGVVCSLWSVDDRETSNLMVAFYRNLQKNQPAPEALRNAQLAMIRAGRPPLYWAPFILIGE